MYVCICRQVTDHQIREFCQRTGASLRDVRESMGVGTECGRCVQVARSVVAEVRDSALYTNAA